MVFSKKRILKEGITKGDKIDYPCEYLHITNIKQIVPISIRDQRSAQSVQICIYQSVPLFLV